MPLFGTPEEQAHKAAEKAEFEAISLIERNAIKLDDLEREWAVLGPLRQISFMVKFRNEDEARSFSAGLPEMGFEVSFVHHPSDGWCWATRAARMMEPTATTVTHWEKWFIARALAFCPENTDHSDESYLPYFVGWSYPDKVMPTFSLQGNVWNRTAAEERSKLLFGATLSIDKVSKSKYWGFSDMNHLAPPFRIVASEFLRKARDRRPADPEPTVSKFAQWLYSLYADAVGSTKDQEEGKAAEEYILAERRKAYTSTDAEIMHKMFPEWRLIHNGLDVADESISRFFTINDLRVGREPLRALPDLMYRNSRSGEIIIVEIKHSRMIIPNNLWPNIWGQLWCYSQLEQVRKAPKVTVGSVPGGGGILR